MSKITICVAAISLIGLFGVGFCDGYTRHNTGAGAVVVLLVTVGFGFAMGFGVRELIDLYIR